MDFFDELDKKLYILTIETIGFLKTLQKAGIENEKTVYLTKLTKELNNIFNNFIDKKSNSGSFSEIKPQLLALITQIEALLTKNFDDAGKEIIHEKADLFISLHELKSFIDNNTEKNL